MSNKIKVGGMFWHAGFKHCPPERHKCVKINNYIMLENGRGFFPGSCFTTKREAVAHWKTRRLEVGKVVWRSYSDDREPTEHACTGATEYLIGLSDGYGACPGDCFQTEAEAWAYWCNHHAILNEIPERLGRYWKRDFPKDLVMVAITKVQMRAAALRAEAQSLDSFITPMHADVIRSRSKPNA